MRQLTPWQFLVWCAITGRSEARRQGLAEPPGFEPLLVALRAAARADTTSVVTELPADTTPANDGGMDDLLTLDESAALVGRSRRTLERWIEHEKLTAHRDGRTVRIRRGDLEASR